MPSLPSGLERYSVSLIAIIYKINDDLYQFPEDDALFGKPTTSGPFMSFFVKGGPLSNSLIPLIRNLGEEYGMLILIQRELLQTYLPLYH